MQTADTAIFMGNSPFYLFASLPSDFNFFAVLWLPS